jgi:hypothetical protein
MVDTEQLRERFLAYLKATFGEEFLRLVDEPQDLRIGERVLYRLAGGKTGTRHEPSEQEIESLRCRMTDVAKSTGVEDSAITFEPPRSSGLPYPRLIDLPGSTIIWDTELKKYLESDDLLPSSDFPLEWAIGVLRTSEEFFLYLDFTHPKVKAVFRGSYDPEHDFRGGTRIGEEFKRFRQKEDALRGRTDADSTIAWAKIVQIDMEPASVRIKSGAKILQVDMEPVSIKTETRDEPRPKRWWKFW